MTRQTPERFSGFCRTAHTVGQSQPQLGCSLAICTTKRSVSWSAPYASADSTHQICSR